MSWAKDIRTRHNDEVEAVFQDDAIKSTIR